jgi:hypothetical protein
VKSGAEFATCYHAGILLVLFYHEDGGDIFLRNVGLNFDGIHGVISQKIILFRKILALLGIKFPSIP